MAEVEAPIAAADEATAGEAAATTESVGAAVAVGKKRARADEPAPTARIADELQLPLGTIMRIVKAKLPDGMMVGTETKKALSKATSLFILYLSTMCAAPARPWPPSHPVSVCSGFVPRVPLSFLRLPR